MEFSNLVRAEEPNVLVEFHEPNPEDPGGGRVGAKTKIRNRLKHSQEA